MTKSGNENVFKDGETDQKRREYAFFCSVFAYIRFFLGHETPFWGKFAKNRRLINYRNRGRKKGGCAVKANYDTPPFIAL